MRCTTGALPEPKAPYGQGGCALLPSTLIENSSQRFQAAPLGGFHDGETLIVTSRVNRTWWKNLRGGAPVKLLLNGKTYQADAIAIGRSASG